MSTSLVVRNQRQNSGPYTIPAHLTSIFEYLKEKIISCADNRDQLIERTREIYCDLLYQMNNGVESDGLLPALLPNAKNIADIIDQENMEFICMTCEESGLTEEETDEIALIYSITIGCMLDDLVGEALWAIGLPVIGERREYQFPVLKSKLHPAQLQFEYAKVWRHG